MQNKSLMIAFSGGLDSQVLLHLANEFARQHDNIRLRAIHIHHGLSKNADIWAEHCQTICKKLEIQLNIQNITIDLSSGQSIEEAARVARYNVFKQLLHKNESLLTGHTQTDQAETLLLQLMRGAGVKGLAAMPEKASLGSGYLLRPLLSVTREALLNYAHGYQLTWTEDESNLEQKFDRNYLRHTVMPLLKKRWPSVIKSLARSSAHCSEADQLLTELAIIDFQTVFIQTDNTLDTAKLLQLTLPRQRNVIRYWLNHMGFLLPSEVKMKKIQNEVLIARKDATPKVHWQGVEVRRYANKLFAMPTLSAHNPNLIIPWNINFPLELPNNLGYLTLDSLSELKNLLANKNNITVRFRQGGERCRPTNRQHSQSLKKLFQEWNVPPWQRDRIPLIYHEDKLIAVLGYCVCEN